LGNKPSGDCWQLAEEHCRSAFPNYGNNIIIINFGIWSNAIQIKEHLEKCVFSKKLCSKCLIKFSIYELNNHNCVQELKKLNLENQ
jgi:hypothetical protein